MLSDRELEVLTLLKQYYYTDKGIAQHLNISKDTVRKHFDNISSKLNINDDNGLKSRRLQLFDYTP